MNMIEIKHNTWPLPNMKDVSENDFWHHMTIWGCPKSEYIQGQKDEDGKSWFSICAFVVNQGALIGGGFVIKKFYSGPRAGQVTYHTFQECAHEFEHSSGGNCYHIHICKKCGARYDVGSSD